MKPTFFVRNGSILIWTLLILGSASQAWAAGLFLTPRGVRPLSMGGAYIASADDLNALSYNPAGLVRAQPSTLLDFGLLLHESQYTRTIEPYGTELPTVTGEGLGIPSPTMGAVIKPWDDSSLVLGFGLAADYPLLQNWPSAMTDGSAAPQRYAILNYEGTAVVRLAGAAGYRVTDWLDVGIALQAFTGQFVSEVVMSNCDGIACVQPENEQYDALVRIASDPFAAFGVHVGVNLTPLDNLRIGLAWESGYRVDTESVMQVRLPSAAMYDSARLNPSEAAGGVAFDLPMSARIGVQWFEPQSWTLEAAFVWEQWSVHDALELSTEGTRIEDIFAIPYYGLSSLDIPRNFRDSWSARVGGEWDLKELDWPGATWRLGFCYEPSAIAGEYLTAMSVDLNKWILGTGFGYVLDGWRFDLTYAYVGLLDEEVKTSQVLQTTATKPEWTGRTAIGDGLYSGWGHVIGVGMNLDF